MIFILRENICFYIGEMMVHYYYVDHSKTSSAQSETSDRGNYQQSSFSCSSEILHGNFFLFGQAVWIICQLLGKIYEIYQYNF
jgi:hypothetical protein